MDEPSTLLSTLIQDRCTFLCAMTIKATLLLRFSKSRRSSVQIDGNWILEMRKSSDWKRNQVSLKKNMSLFFLLLPASIPLSELHSILQVSIVPCPATPLEGPEYNKDLCLLCVALYVFVVPTHPAPCPSKSKFFLFCASLISLTHEWNPGQSSSACHHIMLWHFSPGGMWPLSGSRARWYFG